MMLVCFYALTEDLIQELVDQLTEPGSQRPIRYLVHPSHLQTCREWFPGIEWEATEEIPAEMNCVDLRPAR